MRRDQMHSRFKDAPWYTGDYQTPTYILLGGAGGIGSWTALLLSRAGFRPVVYDFDTVEAHNIGGQLYDVASIEKLKVEALHKIIVDFAEISIDISEERMNEESSSNKYVISAFDNMIARKQMFENWVKLYASPASSHYDPTGLFIDGRLTAEQMWIYCVKASSKDDIEAYRKTIFPDSELPDDPCTFRQTSHAAAMIASHIVGFLTNHITNIIDGDDVRAVPFEWEYIIPMDLKQVTKL